jgi:putative SOS response-associated peptidase YedK
VEGLPRRCLIPHFREKRLDFAPIHARAETIAENEWFSDAYRKRRCVVPMNSFFQKDATGKRYAISRRDGQVFGVAGIWENWRAPLTSITGAHLRRHHRSGERPHCRSTIACSRYCQTNSFRAGSVTKRTH